MYKDFFGNIVEPGDIIVFTDYDDVNKFRLAIFDEQNEEGSKFKLIVCEGRFSRNRSKGAKLKTTYRLRDKPFIKISPNSLSDTEPSQQMLKAHALRYLKSFRY